MDNELADILYLFVVKSFNDYNDYILIINGSLTLTYLETTMPSRWISTILPFIPPENTYESIIVDDCLYVSMKNIFRKGMPEKVLEIAYQSLNVSIMNKLRYLYIFGTIVLNPEIDRYLILNWNLIKNPSLVSSMTTSKNVAIYHALWNNTLFASDKTYFLEKIASKNGKNIVIKITNPIFNNPKGNIKNDNLIKDGDNVYFKCDSHYEANSIINKLI
jgi:hypothetical protein